jgi:hypothetical protein
MPSFRARLTNAFLRMTAKSIWKPGGSAEAGTSPAGWTADSVG